MASIHVPSDESCSRVEIQATIPSHVADTSRLPILRPYVRTMTGEGYQIHKPCPAVLCFSTVQHFLGVA